MLHFAVTGALLGGVGIGCSKHRGPIVNTEMAGDPPTQPSVEPEPEDVGAPDQTPVEPEPDHVNEGPVDEPEPTPKHVNVRKESDPE